jgi:hypothetical protein
LKKRVFEKWAVQVHSRTQAAEKKKRDKPKLAGRPLFFEDNYER